MNVFFRSCLVAILLVSTSLRADVLGLEAGASFWEPDYTGNFALNAPGFTGTQVNIKDDLGYGSQSHNIYWVSIEHPLPILPNFKIVSSDLNATSSARLSKAITFGGQTFSVSDDVTSRFDLSNTEYTLYYELLDNWLTLDAGLTLRKYNGQANISTTSTGASEKLDFSIPLIYLNARFDLPFTGFFVDSQLNTVSVGDNSITDTAVSLGYESSIGLGARLGYRSLDLQFDESDLTGDLKFKGTYLNAFYHF